MKQTMQLPAGNGVYMTTITVILYFITRFTITEWAGIATILAAGSTFGLNLYRFLKDKKNKP